MLLMRIRELEHENARLVTRVNDSMTAHASGGSGSGLPHTSQNHPHDNDDDNNNDINSRRVLREATSIVDRETQPPLSLYDPPSSVASSLSQQHISDTLAHRDTATAAIGTDTDIDLNLQVQTDFKKIDLRESHFSPNP